MHSIKNKSVLIIFATFAIVFIIVAMLLSNFTNVEADNIFLDTGWHIEINDVSYEDVTVSDFLFPVLNKGDVLKMSYTLPSDTTISSPIFLFYTIHSDVEIICNGNRIYTYGQNLREDNKLLGYGYHFVSLPKDYSSAKIDIIMNITENDAFSSIKIPQICDNSTFYRNFIIENCVPLTINCFLIIFGILLILISIIFCIYDKKFFQLVCVGFFSFGIGLWSLCNYDLIFLFTYDLRVKAYIEFLALYISPLFVILYFWKDKFVTRNKVVETIYKIILGTQICFDVVALILQFTNIVHLPALLRILHLILYCMCGGIIILTVYDLVKRQLQNKVLILGLVIMLCVGIGDMLRFSVMKYMIPTGDLNYTSYLCIGAMIFVLSQLADFCTKIVNIFVQGTKAQMLEQMAYIDVMTGIANRRRCEEVLDSLDKETTNYGIYVFDLNNLKITNDTKGHALGDILIQTFANVLSKTFDGTGIVARIGGDEFIAIIPDITNIDTDKLIEQFNQEVSAANIKNPNLDISAAYGFSSHAQHPDFDSRKVYRQADVAMYKHKLEIKKAIN